MEQLAELPPLAIIALGVTLAIIFGVRYLGLSAGENAPPSKSQSAAQVAAVIVDPTALNNATSALKEHTECLGDLIDVLKDIGSSMAKLAIETDRIREELRIQRELSRRP